MDCELPLVSVIIPVYNSEAYLDRCLQSVVNQSYKKIEIIVVNDGSTDASPSIIEEYALQDSRFITVNRANGGLVEARKSGINVARGKYIQYLDSDDALVKDAIELLVNKAENTQAEIVIAPFNFNEEGEKRCSDFFEFDQMSGIQYLKYILKSEAYWTVWSKFHLRSLYLNNIESLNIAFGEDVVLSTQLLVHAKRIVSINIPIIDYYIYPSSMSHNLNDKAYHDFNSYVLWFDSYIVRKNMHRELAKELAFFHVKNTMVRLHWKRSWDTNREMKRVMRELQTYPELKQILSRREEKIVKAYGILGILGYLKLLRYIRQGKI